MLLAVAIHFVVNSVIKEFPSRSFSGTELRAYFTEQFDAWAVVHGARYVAVVAMVLFFAGVFVRTCGHEGDRKGWGIVGLLGTAILATSLTITNGLETFSYLDLELLRENQELFWLLRDITRTLFAGEFVASALVLLGFSVAGWYSRRIPRWIVYLGYVSAASALLSVIFIVSVLTDGWAAPLANIIAPLTAIVWFVSVGVIMLRHGAE